MVEWQTRSLQEAVLTSVRVQISSSLSINQLHFKRSDIFGTYQNYQGTRDYLAGKYGVNGVTSETVRFIENRFAQIAKTYGFGEVIAPIIEFEELYRRSVGETTDVVQKEMFSFSRGKDDLVLRPEGTAGVIRSFVQNKLYTNPDEMVKLFYKGSMFRYERPQSGRQREFVQLGVEAIGDITPFAEAEIIAFTNDFIKSFNLQNVRLQINSIGCKTCRANYKEQLLSFLESKNLCELCENRKAVNPLRVLDCKNNACQENLEGAPLMSECLCTACKNDFSTLYETLDTLQIDYKVEPRLVRGLDYYAKTVFEFVETSIGAQSTLCGGGRYEGLVEELGSPVSKSGFGCALGLERLLISLTNQNLLPNFETSFDYYLVWTGEKERVAMMKIAQTLRNNGYAVEMEFKEKKLKNQFKVANRKNAKFVLILGEEELKNNTISVKNLTTSEQTTVSMAIFLKEKDCQLPDNLS